MKYQMAPIPKGWLAALGAFFLQRLRNRWLIFLHDLLWVPVSILVAYDLRFNLNGIPANHLPSLYLLLIIALPVQALFFWRFGLYRGIWRFASIPDHMRVLKTVLFGSMISILLLFILQRLEGVPRSVLLLYPLLMILGLSTPRILYRWYKDHHLGLGAKESKRALVVGAGRAGEMLLRDLARNNVYQVVALVDDNPALQGNDIHGVGVSGTLDEIVPLVEQMAVEVILMAIPSACSEVLDRVVDQCTQVGLPCHTLPSLMELAGAEVRVSSLRPVTVKDLLGREPVPLDNGAITAYLKEKCVFVTGGGGSIGAELCRQIALQSPHRLVILDYCEYNLFQIDLELQRDHANLQYNAILGDVRSKARILQIFNKYRPNVVFHAAALKHVPMVEDNAEEGVWTNILGTRIVADAAGTSGCDRFVLISTDKAVNPANIMGATKRVAEIYCQNLNGRSSTRFITTRFGNVLDSSGSVVPLFKQQIERGGPITVTHKEITRYFMTIPEAVGLILQAGSMGEGGEIFILDMGQPIKILHLAEQMISLSGRTNIKIEITGLRPGEKLFEELFHAQENLQPTSHKKILLAGYRKVDWQEMMATLLELRQSCEQYNRQRLTTLLCKLVPEYQAYQETLQV